ncbi:MAG TPA: hypothetical protein VMI54_24225 [Polyangiaceae bacterium]|nr:hypothetical protein [Polyangiaceae bacterium]
MRTGGGFFASRLLAAAPGVCAWLGWFGLETFRLRSIPGLDLDEAWYILAGWRQWEQADPFSGLNRYSGALPILFARLVGFDAPWFSLRLLDVFANGLALVLLSAWLRRRHAARSLRGWALPFVATVPLFAISSRHAVETAIFGPLLTFAGLFLLELGGGRAVFGAGLAWGLAAYNHVLWAFVPVTLALAWVAVYRRLPALPWVPLLAGLAVGGAPRALSLLFYADRSVGGPGESWRLGPALADVPALPDVLWRALDGSALYHRFVGAEAVPVLPYFALALAFFVPFLRHPARTPRPLKLLLLFSLLLATTTAILSPLYDLRYLLAPVLALALCAVEAGATLIEWNARFRFLVWPVAAVVVGANLFYFCADFIAPWQRGSIGFGDFALGKRNPHVSNLWYFPRDRLLRTLRELGPEQILASPSLERPLRVLLAHDKILVRLPKTMQPGLRTVWVDYYADDARAERCTAGTCFRRPLGVDGLYSVFR